MRNANILFIVLLTILTGCRIHEQDFVNFMNAIPSDDDPKMFRVLAQINTDLSNGIPDQCYLADGTLLSDFEGSVADVLGDENVSGGPMRTSSVTPANVIQALLGWGSQNKVVQLPGLYESLEQIGDDYEPILLSGKVILPADGHFRRYILVSHYTLGSNQEAPSNCFSLEGILAKLGYCVILPDYEGYGITVDHLHPYLMMVQSAINVIDMYYAVKNYMEARGIRPDYDDIYLMGYSQGGATTMAVEMMIESGYAEFMWNDTPKIRRVFAGGGPYDVKSTYDRFVTTNLSGYPVAVPLVVQGMTEGYPQLGLKKSDFMEPWVIDILENKVNAKIMSTNELNKVIGTTVTSDLLTDLGMDRTSEKVCLLYKCMSENSVINMGWEPQAPVYMFHSIDDETVPYENATRARTKWNNANIKFNYGHYGTHQFGCLRFIKSVQILLKEDQEQEDSL